MINITFHCWCVTAQRSGLQQKLLRFVLWRLCRARACFSTPASAVEITAYSLCRWSFQFAVGKTERLRMYTHGGRAAVTELSWSRLLEGTLREREQSQKSEETYFTLLILSIVLNEGHSRPKAHLCIFSLCAWAPRWTTRRSYSSWKKGSRVCVDVWEKVCVSDPCSEVLTLIWGCRKLLYEPIVVILQILCRLCVGCSVSGVCGVNQPIVLDHVHHPGSPENELPCRGKTPRPHRPHRGSWPFALHQRYAPLSLTYSSTVTRLWMDFSRQILIESSVTSLGLKQMSISNYGSWSRSVFHFCFAWHPHLFYIPISPVRWDRVCFCTLSLNSYSITRKFLPRTSETWWTIFESLGAIIMFFGEQNQIFILYTRWPSEATGIKQSYHIPFAIQLTT